MKYYFKIGEETIWSCDAFTEDEAVETFSEVKRLSPATIREMYQIKREEQK